MKMHVSKKISLICFCLFIACVSIAQNDTQIQIPRVGKMPDLPVPYEMRNWKEIALGYDKLVYDTEKSGDYFPLVEQKGIGNNYSSIIPMYMPAYVGNSNQAEAINILPSIIGASLVGIDKSNQDGNNWVSKIVEFYNRKNEQNLYLNNYSSKSGGDWWYDVMPNIYFYQLYTLYPLTPKFNTQFISVAEQWYSAVVAMGGSSNPWNIPYMNYRGWHFEEMQPNTEGVPEPEAAGAIAWILYNAFKNTGDTKYLNGARWCMDYLNSLDVNPSYELQLPYGVLNAARMNAEQGTAYDIEKLINWCFDRGPLRGWGVIVGQWDGKDMSGLIGEANDSENDYAFAMNGFQQAAALAPLIKYDERFAKDIAKWLLNLANSSRFFYSKYLSEDKQTDFEWCNRNDPSSVIAYEAIKENWNGKYLYATGDAKINGWAPTNLALYGSSSVGYLASIIETTNIDGVLLIDLNITDFFGNNVIPTYLIYNPYNQIVNVEIDTGVSAVDIYDVISEKIIIENVSGQTIVQMDVNQVMMLKYLPVGSELNQYDGKLMLGETVIDYNYGLSLSAVDLIQNNRLRVYPNPASNFLKIDSDLEINRIDFVDLNGKLFFSQRYQTIYNPLHVDLTDQFPSVFIMRAYSGNSVISRTLQRIK